LDPQIPFSISPLQVYTTLNTKLCAQKPSSWYLSFLLTLPGLKGIDQEIRFSCGDCGPSPIAFARSRFLVGEPNFRLAEHEISILYSPL